MTVSVAVIVPPGMKNVTGSEVQVIRLPCKPLAWPWPAPIGRLTVKGMGVWPVRLIVPISVTAVATKTALLLLSSNTAEAPDVVTPVICCCPLQLLNVNVNACGLLCSPDCAEAVAVPRMNAANIANSVDVLLGVNMRTSFSMSKFSGSGQGELYCTVALLSGYARTGGPPQSSDADLRNTIIQEKAPPRIIYETAF